LQLNYDSTEMQENQGVDGIFSLTGYRAIIHIGQSPKKESET